MNHRQQLAIIGSGPSSIYLLKHLLDEAALLKHHICEIAIFEKSPVTGMGMPYSPRTTDRYNMSNISSEELPELPEAFAEWLRAQEPAVLKAIHMEGVPISKSEVYSRLALGRYLHAQYQTLIARLTEAGIQVLEHPGCEIKDVQDHPAENKVSLTTAEGTCYHFGRVIIATGHYWTEDDKPSAGYYASPWPIFKVVPKDGAHYNFAIGTLGASLSAFDVISSLAHRHGRFIEDSSGHMTFEPHPGTEGFKIIMHSSHGLLPHLQFDQVEPFREIYRHVDRNTLLGLIDDRGFLRLDTYFDKVCRPALIKAFTQDQMPELVNLLDDPQFNLKYFVEKMADKHDYENAFEGMRFEMIEAKKSVENHQPIHWKEVIDDLMYTLNFHAELMPAEDHLFLKSTVMPFLMNVIAAMPLPSGNTILALYDAGKLDIISGKVSLAEEQLHQDMTTIIVKADADDKEAKESTIHYRMFIDCSGQKPLELDDYPFPSLVKSHTVRKARVAFASPEAAAEAQADDKIKEHLILSEHADKNEIHLGPLYHTGGIDIAPSYHLLTEDGVPCPRIHDIAFPHTSGVRPYSYGLQACNHTAAILIKDWVAEYQNSATSNKDLPQVTKLYDVV